MLMPKFIKGRFKKLPIQVLFCNILYFFKIFINKKRKKEKKKKKEKNTKMAANKCKFFEIVSRRLQLMYVCAYMCVVFLY